MGDLVRKVRETLGRHRMVERGDGVVVGVSGGPDSVALLVCLADLREMLALRLHVAHLDHMLRGADAEQDAQYVRNLAESLKIPSTVDQVDVAALSRSLGTSVEEAGRSARYAFFAQVARSLGFTRVAVAHHLDDQAETVLMRIVRGTGVRGLAGIPPVRPLQGGFSVIRPLAHVTRAEIEEFLRERGLSPRQDVSNQETVYTRNRIRRELLPLLEARYNSGIREALERLACSAAEDDAFLTSLAREKLAHLRSLLPPGSLPRDLASALPASLLARVLNLCFAEVAGDRRDLYHVHIGNLIRLLSLGTAGDSVDLPRGVQATLTYDRLVFELREPPEGAEEVGSSPGAPLPRVRLAVPGITVLSDLGWAILAAVDETDGEERREKDLDAQGVQGLAAVARAAFARCGLGDIRCDPDDIGTEWAVFDQDELPGELSARPWSSGDRMAPFGMAGTKKLSDLFSDLKIPRRDRSSYPVVLSGDRVIWVAGLRAGRDAPVVGQTRRVLALARERACERVADG
ncbi:MAG: tRNA lysidine(34) synthetase TilS [Firmicutes bacterium]|nr:tRNA lysidine(34) synthetase TilS [Bacillota bacterium]